MTKLYPLICFLACIPLWMYGQSGQSCSSAVITTPQTINQTKFTLDTTYLSLKLDSNIVRLIVAGRHQGLDILMGKQNGCETNSRSYSFTSLNQQTIDQKKIEAGFCFCHICLAKSNRIRIKQERHLIIKVYGKKSKLNFRFVTKDDLKEKAWFERKYKKGDAIQLKNILFYPESANFLRSSMKELEQLHQLLKTQPKLKVEIQGHVNGPFRKNGKEFQELSERRAKAVYNYLIKKGIAPNRLNHKGFGNTRMVYPRARTEDQMVFNRRVEIMVL